MRKILFASTLIFVLFSQSMFSQKRKLTLKEVTDYKSEVITKSIPNYPRWQDDENYLESSSPGSPSLVVNVKTGKKSEYKWTSANGIVVQGGQVMKLGPDGRKILLEKQEGRTNMVLSPDSNWVAFTYKNNLYAYEIASGRQVQYTSDGSGVILNGVASWVYYEEILDHATATFWWSPDSKYIGFFRTDESKVPEFPVFNESGQHGSLQMQRYPKAGDPNPEVKVGIVGVEGGPVVWADFDPKQDQYFGKTYWSPDSHSFWVQWMPREQNQLKIYAIDIQSGMKKEVYTEEQPTWVDWKDDLRFLKKQQAYLVQSDVDGWDQLYLYNMDGRLKNKITNGNFWETKILFVDEAKQTIYFTSRKEISTRRDLYSVKFNGSSFKRLTFGEYDHNVLLSPNAKYFITKYSNISTPIQAALVDAGSGKVIRHLEDTKGDEFDNLELGRGEVVWYTTPDGFRIPAVITYPPNMDNTRKHPVIINMYGGPNRGQVVDRWWGGTSWRTLEGIISVVLDHRGSGHCGRKGLDYMHRNLGKYEIEDYITFVKQYLYENQYVDRSKIAIEGHSYGGYLTALALTKGAEYFKYGVADAGVMDWMLYDTHYTERYMDTPQSNPEGYKAGSVLTYIDNYKNGSNFLLIRHGLIDDNVHPQNSLQLIDRLQLKKLDFEMILYPGCSHSYIGKKMNLTQNEKNRFYYKYLLNREMPDDLYRE